MNCQKKSLSILLIFSILFLPACGAPEHKHSVLPGSEYCETCGKKISICKKCGMVNDLENKKCWFCKSEF